MRVLADELNREIEKTVAEWSSFPKSNWFEKPNAEKWSKAEIAGHLVDSALNNIQRFIRAQHEAAPHIFYDQNEWVRLQNYQQVEKQDVIQLWALLNRQISRLFAQMPAENLEFSCYFKVNGVIQTVPLRDVMVDYVAHLRHHLGQIKG
jgi:DinB superfamily